MPTDFPPAFFISYIMEKLYHYLWKTGIAVNGLKDIDGSQIEVIDPGIHNYDSGPDFFNSKIKINGVEWIGNVEIHVKASDWLRHGHSDDPAYENVILHVVGVSDKRISRPDGTMIPQVVLTLPEKFFKTYASLSAEDGVTRCSPMLVTLPSLNKTDWLESLSVERLQQKATKIKEIYAATNGDWEQTCFIMLARGLGFGLNGDPFELLAKSLPLRILHHHSDNLFQLEALLFGQAAMLDPTLHMFDEYFQALCREYYFLSRKYNLKPLRPGLWKYARTRPGNFPHRRIAMLANQAVGGFSLFSRLIENGKDLESFSDLFRMNADGYWKKHFSFDTPAVSSVATDLSSASRTLLIINVGIPLLYAYASATSNPELGEKMLSLLQDLPAENNGIIREWQNLGFKVKDASQSQALIHLKKEYCERNKCIYCRFGHHFLRKSASRVD